MGFRYFGFSWVSVRFYHSYCHLFYFSRFKGWGLGIWGLGFKDEDIGFMI